MLELKEELHKAEADLVRLKTKWANHERTRKRAEIRHVEPLRPLPNSLGEIGRSSEEGEGATRQSIELDRQKAIMSINHKVLREPRRKVFSGSHQRTLSLLSPERSHFTRPFPAVEGANSDNAGFPRSTTMPDTSMGFPKVNTNRARHSYQGGVTHGAKQIAEDVKAGLWTFLEDLRQATVGEEATTTAPRLGADVAAIGPKKKGSKTSLKTRDKSRSPGATTSPRTWDPLTGSGVGLGLSDGVATLSSDGLSKKDVTATQKVTVPLSLAPAIDDLDDNWSNWDSPTPKSPRWSGSTDLSNPATPSHAENRSVK